MLETVLSLVIFAFSLWALDALNFNKLLKSNRVMQAQVLYLFLAMALTALVVQFLLALRITN